MFDVTLLTCPKSFSSLEESEDAAAWEQNRGLFVVCDGVGEGPFPGIWAKLLVERFVARPLPSSDWFEATRWLRPARGAYWAEIEQKKPLLDAIPGAWDRVLQGDAATFLAARVLSLNADSSVAIRVLSIGDSCFFQFQDGELIESFPLHNACQFSSVTRALPTRNLDIHLHRLDQKEFEIQQGDTIMLATDAVAKWLLARWQHDKRSILALEQQTQSSWEDLVLNERDRGTMVDDDSTLLVCKLAKSFDSPSTLGESGEDTTQRYLELKRALESGDEISIAEAYGDGSAFEGIDLSSVEIQRIKDARDRAQSFLEMLSILRKYIGQPASRRDEVWLATEWAMRRELLISTKCAEKLVKTLRDRFSLE